MNERQKDFTIKLSQFHQLFDKSTWVDGDNSSTPRKPYGQVELVFRCVEELVNSVSGLPLVLSTIDEKIIESGPQYDILFNNPLMSFKAFIIQTVGHYALSRDVFWVFTDFNGSRPKEIAVISGSQMHAVTHNRQTNGELIGWEFRGSGGQKASYSLSEVYQIKNFNPYDRFHGVGPTSAAKLSINYSYAASLFNTSALDNAAEPGLLLVHPSSPSPEEVTILREQFDSRHRGAAKAKRTAILTGGMNVKTAALKMTDMQLAEISEMKDRRICSTFGVPPEIVGLGTEAQYAQGPAQRAFIFNTVMPLGDLISDELTYGILSKFYSDEAKAVKLKNAKSYSGMRTRSLVSRRAFRRSRNKAISEKKQIFSWFDYDQHPVVQEYQREVSEKVFKFTQSGVTLNNLIEAHDLPYEIQPWGDEWWIGMGQVPANYILEAGPEGITGPAYTPPPEEEGKTIENRKSNSESLIVERSKLDVESSIKATIWQRWVASWLPIEREYHQSLRVLFVRQERELIDKLKKALEAEGKSSGKITDDIIARIVFDLKKENGKLKVINTTFFNKASELGIRQSIKEIAGLKGDELDKLTAQVQLRPTIKGKLTISNFKISKVNEFTQKKVAETLHEGLGKGENLTQLTERIKIQLGSNRARALRIARTQTGGAVNTGRHEGLKASGVELKSWLTAKDENVRTAHRQAEADSVEGIPINTPFNVGGELLMYPGDPAGSPGNIINCRCMQIARMAKGKKINLTYYSNVPFATVESVDNKINKEHENGT